MEEVQVTGPTPGFLWQKNVQPLYVAGAKQARGSELIAFPESWSRRLRVGGSGGLKIALKASGLQQAGHQTNGDRKSSGLSDIVSYDCLFGKRKPCREQWCPIATFWERNPAGARATLPTYMPVELTHTKAHVLHHPLHCPPLRACR